MPHSDLWKTSHEWLKATGNRLNSNYCKEEITTHPDYPALLSLIDFLDSGGLAFQAVQADSSYIDEFNYPLLAHIKQPGDEYMHIISDVTEWSKQKEITDHWTGIAVYLEKNTRWQNGQNIIYQYNEVKNKIISASLIFVGVLIFVFSTSGLLQHYPLRVGGFGLLSLAGLTISILALGTEVGIQSEIVKQVCGSINTGGCEKVLKSRYAKGFLGVTPADASVFYFAAQFVVYLLGCWYPSLLQGIYIFAFGGIAVSVWSVYTQAAKLKEWCAICLALVAVLLLQSIIAFTSLPHLHGFLSETFFVAVFLILALGLLPIKRLIKTNSTNKLELLELKKWKLDADLFVIQWQKEQSVDIAIWQNDLLLGDPEAPLQITVACNPYCGPCSKAHAQLDNLLHRFAGKIKVQIRLLCPVQDENNKITIAVKSILQKAATIKNNIVLQQMLSEWFQWMDYDKWVQKWIHPSPLEEGLEIRERLGQHSQWIKQSNIGFTPTFFINGRKIPGRYSLSDIGILIPQLAQTGKINNC